MNGWADFGVLLIFGVPIVLVVLAVIATLTVGVVHLWHMVF